MSHPLETLPPVARARVIETGSDMAEFCLFDAAAARGDFSTRSAAEQRKMIDAHERAGRLCRIRTGYDGSYVLHIFAEQELPVQFAERCREPLKTIVLTTEGGKMMAVATEDIANIEPDDPRFSFALAPGAHQVTIWKTNWPEATVAAAQKARVIGELGLPAWEKRNRRGLCQVAVVIALILGGFFCLGSTLLSAARASFGWKGLLVLWASWIAAIQIVPRLMLRTCDSRAVVLEVETAKEFPDFVIWFSQVHA